MLSRAVGIALGVVADQAFGDPRRAHPVAAFGATAQRLEKRTYRDEVAAGAGHTLALLVPLGVLGWLAERGLRRRPWLHALATAAVTWSVLGARSLAREGGRMAERLRASDIDGARGQLGNLCGRDPDQLDAPELARATIESMAENTADAAVASLFWGAVAGMPGMLVHRGANTLDAMIGHHNDRYERFGRFAARLDDALDLLPARITGAVIATLAPTVGGSSRSAWRILARDHAKHPSPNGGWCESAMAGALGVRLGGRNVYYGGRVEVRGDLGDGRRPGPDDVRRSVRLVTGATGVVAVLAVGACALRDVGSR